MSVEIEVSESHKILYEVTLRKDLLFEYSGMLIEGTHCLNGWTPSSDLLFSTSKS